MQVASPIGFLSQIVLILKFVHIWNEHGIPVVPVSWKHYKEEIMKLRDGIRSDKAAAWILAAALAVPVFAQGPPPPMYRPDELDRIVSRIALYPDPLLSQTLAAATFPEQIPDAARWADQHHYITGDALARTINDDRLPWDPSVQSLLPFPRVLDMMASDPGWTNQLANAFLSQQPQVMDAVQRMRRRARDYGYLRSGPQVVVSNGPYIEIMPVNPGFVVVPYYDPLIVYAAPRPGFFVGGAINFGFGVSIGAAFRPWGWGASRFGWGGHTVIINNNNWNRTWVNRTTYVHPYTVQRYANVPRVEERHEIHAQSVQEREAIRGGRVVREEHRDEHRHEERREERR